LRGISFINAQLRKRFEILNHLAHAIHAGVPIALPPAALDTMAEARQMAKDNLDKFRGWLLNDLKAARELQDLAPEVQAIWEYITLQLSDHQQTTFIETALLYDLAADLIDKVPMKPILIAPPGVAPGKHELSGDPLYGFGGFFAEKFRDRDYQQGAARCLPNLGRGEPRRRFCPRRNAPATNTAGGRDTLAGATTGLRYRAQPVQGSRKGCHRRAVPRASHRPEPAFSGRA
jgi:hypothetical protein